MSLLYHLSRFVQYRLSVRMSAVLSSRLEQLIKVNFSPRSRRNEFKQVSFRLPVNYNIKGRDRRPGGGRFRMFCCKQFGSNYPMTCFSISFCDIRYFSLEKGPLLWKIIATGKRWKTSTTMVSLLFFLCLIPFEIYRVFLVH